MLLTAAPYSTGTVAVTQGSTAIVLAGGAWTAAMNGQAFRTVNRSEFYAFTFSDATHGALDRPYEGDGDGDIGYSLFQHIYPLPADCRLLKDDAFSGRFGPMKRVTHGELNLTDPRRQATGTPQFWASYMDDSSTPPNMQVELYPIPQIEVGIPFSYVAAGPDLASTTAILQVWLQPAALLEGVTAKIKMHLKDYTGAQLHAAAAGSALKNMRTSEAQEMAPTRMRLDPYYTDHRMRRGR